jgi:hypothetical protein
MMHLRKLGLAAAMSLVAACAMVSTASATTIEPANTEVTAVATDGVLSVHGSAADVSCGTGTITATTGALTHSTWASATIDALTFANCSVPIFGATVVTPAAACSTTGRPILHAMTVSSTSSIGLVTLPASCSFDIRITSLGCTMTVTGGQTIGNGTAGVGGINWSNLSPKSRATLNAATVPKVDSNGVGFGCPSAGAHTGTLSGNYNITSPTNVTVTG